MVFIGVQKSEQGKGIGTSLLLDIKHMAKTNNMPLVLETSTIENIDFYKKNGFTLYSQEEMYGYTLYFFRYTT